MKKFVVDTHTHTIVSGHAYSTLIENCEEAYKKGIKVLGATEHGPAMPGGPHIFYFGDMKVIPDYINNVRVLKGTEANIIDFEGHLDVDVDRLERLELVIASLHDVCMPKGSRKDNTRALIGAMKSGYVDIIGHPGNPYFPIEVDEVLKAAKEYNVLIEINNSSFNVSRKGSAENCLNIARKAKENGNIMAAGTDSHICFTIGEFGDAIKVLKEAGCTDDDVINTDENKLLDYLRKKGKIK